MTVNKVCGSSLKAIMLAATAIRAGEHRCIVAGGMESMTNAPQLLMGQRRGTKMGDSTLVDSMIHDGLWDVYNDMHMGNTGEVVSEEFSITREGMDAFAARASSVRQGPSRRLVRVGNGACSGAATPRRPGHGAGRRGRSSRHHRGRLGSPATRLRSRRQGHGRQREHPQRRRGRCPRRGC